MLLGAITVFVVVATGDPALTKDPANRAMEKALRTALGREAAITVRRGGGETEEQLLVWASGEHANLLGVLSWSEDQRRATLRFVHPADGRWADREIRFDAADIPAERGRTVGFAFASMVPDDALPPRPDPPSAAPATTPGGDAPTSAAPPAETMAPPPPRPPGRTSIEAAGTAVGALGGYGGGIGAVIGVRYAIAPPLLLHFAFAAREGDVGPAQATSHILVGAAGLAYQTWLGAARRWGAGARLDALLIGHELVHLSADDNAPAHLFRLLPGAGAAVEGVWRFAEPAALFAGFGLEVAFGRTQVFVREKAVAELAPVRVLGEAGVRVSF